MSDPTPILFNIISRLMNFSNDLGQIMTRYDSLEAWQVILSNVSPTWPNYTLVNFSYELKNNNDPIYDFLEARWVNLNNVRSDSNLT